MFNRYFQDELANLRDLGAEFSESHPAIAPMLSGATTDPDVERLLEGVAFLTALMRQKLDDDFPEIIHELIRLIWPHYLRPIPSSTVVGFRPKPTLKQSASVPAGTHLNSVPVEGTSCTFRTCCDVELHPIELMEAGLVEAAGKPPAIRLVFELRGLKLEDWSPTTLRFFLAGDYREAADLYLLLRRYLRQVIITPLDGGHPIRLSPENIQPVGFSGDEGLIPYPTRSFPGYRILQEYFVFPERFLFLDLLGWNRWVGRGGGNRFEVLFELDELPFNRPRIRKQHFVLSATPAVNIFPQDAEPIRIDHKSTEYPVRSTGGSPEHYQVYSIQRVVGFVQGTAEQRTFVPFDVFSPRGEGRPRYHLSVRQSPTKNVSEVYLSVAYPPEMKLAASETLSLQLECTNGALAENLQAGDISVPTSDSPEFAEFLNIRAPSAAVLPPLGKNLLWRLLSHLSLNYQSLGKAESLRAILELYVFEETRDRARVLANQKRISGIEDVSVSPTSKIVSGVMMRGQDILIRLREDHFAGPGDLFLFGSVLDSFLGSYASMNTYTQLTVEEVSRGDRYQWPARIGEHPLI